MARPRTQFKWPQNRVSTLSEMRSDGWSDFKSERGRFTAGSSLMVWTLPESVQNGKSARASETRVKGKASSICNKTSGLVSGKCFGNRKNVRRFGALGGASPSGCFRTLCLIVTDLHLFAWRLPLRCASSCSVDEQSRSQATQRKVGGLDVLDLVGGGTGAETATEPLDVITSEDSCIFRLCLWPFRWQSKCSADVNWRLHNVQVNGGPPIYKNNTLGIAIRGNHQMDVHNN